MSRLIIQGKVIRDRQVVPDQMMICQRGKITFVGPRDGQVPDFVVEKGFIAPGYIDIHIHGSHGYDVMDGTGDSLRGMAKSLIKYGVTSFLATTLTAKTEDLLKVLVLCKEVVGEPYLGSELLGVHLEGPWINRCHKGAQNEQHIVCPTLEDAEKLLKTAGGLLKLVTLAPEQSGAKQVIQYLSEHGVKVAVGHSDADYETVKEAIEYGLSHVTHCCNAMRGFHHREPGVVGAAMVLDELTTEFIADGIHVHPVVLSIFQRIKTTDRVILVSDGIRAVGLRDGEYDLGGLRVHLRNGEARLVDGTLAGSMLTLDQAVRNMVSFCGVSLPDAVAMASEIPANVIGLGHCKGRLAVGYDADLIFLDEELNVVKTFVGGKILI